MTFPLKNNFRFSRLAVATALVSALLLALNVAACLEKPGGSTLGLIVKPGTGGIRDGDTGVSRLPTIAYWFSHPMNTSSVEAAFSVTPVGGEAVTSQGFEVTWRDDQQVVGFVKTGAPLASLTAYAATLDTSTADARGATLEQSYSLSFTTNNAEIDATIGMEFVELLGGSFEMGCGAWTSSCGSDESVVRTVTLDSFMLGKYEVTQGEWAAVMGSNPSTFQDGDNYPVEVVSWEDVQSFITALNALSSSVFRLPTEAEWEYACRSGGEEVMYGTSGDAMTSRHANYKNNIGQTTAAGSYSPNTLGLYDMSGNVWEWVQDVYTSSYDNVGTDNPVYEGSGAYSVLRGGSWLNDALRLRCSYRYRHDPLVRYSDLGFRLLRTP